MKLRFKLLAASLIILLTALYVKWDKKHSTVTVPAGDATIVERPGGTTVTAGRVVTTVPNYGHGTRIVRTNDVLSVAPVVYGLSFDPGFSTDFTRLGLGLEIGYYKRLGLLVGSNFWQMSRQRFDPTFFIGVGYRLPLRKLSNLSVYTGIDNRKTVTLGLFLRLGNS